MERHFHFHSGAAGMPHDPRRWRWPPAISWRLPVCLSDRNMSHCWRGKTDYWLRCSVWPRSFAVPGIERCPVRTVAIFSWSSCDIIAADRRGLSTNASAQEKGDTVAGARLGAAPWQAGLRWFRNCLQVSTRDFGPGELAGHAWSLQACILMKLV